MTSPSTKATATTTVSLLLIVSHLVGLGLARPETKVEDEKSSLQFQPRPPIQAGNGAQTFGGNRNPNVGTAVGGQSYFPGNNNNNNNGYPGGSPTYNNNNNNGGGGEFFPDNTIGNGPIVGFSAVRANGYTLSAGNTVRFERTLTDVGYGWDSNTSSFQVSIHKKNKAKN